MPRNCVFDVNETLLDLSALDPVFEQLFGDPAVRGQWFAQLLQTALVSTVTDTYQDFALVGRAALEMTAARRGVELPEGAAEDVGAAMRSLPAHPDVAEGIGRLKEAGYPIAALTNSPLAVAAAQLEHAGVAGLFDEILSAEQVQRLKPAPEPYRMAAEVLGVEPAGIRLIAAHAWDVTGAIRAGCAAAFVARPGAVLDPLGETPDVVAADLPQVAEAIIALEQPLTD